MTAILAGPARLIGPSLATFALARTLRAATLRTVPTTAVVAPFFSLCRRLSRRGFAAGLSRWRGRRTGPRWPATAFAPPIPTVPAAMTLTLAVITTPRTAIDGPMVAAMTAPWPPDLDEHFFGWTGRLFGTWFGRCFGFLAGWHCFSRNGFAAGSFLLGRGGHGLRRLRFRGRRVFGF